MTVSRMASWLLPLLACAALALVAQGLLTSLKFSNTKGEAVFRGLYAASYLANMAVAVFCRPSGMRQWLQAVVLALPACMVTVLMLSVLMGRDAQGGIAVLLLPLLHGALLVPATLIATALRRPRRAA